MCLGYKGYQRLHGLQIPICSRQVIFYRVYVWVAWLQVLKAKVVISFQGYKGSNYLKIETVCFTVCISIKEYGLG